MGSSTPLRVLFLNGEEQQAELQAEALRRAGLDIDWTRAASEGELRRSLHPPVDLILSARCVDGLDAPAALRLVRQEGELLPFIVVDPGPEDGLAATCLQEGALACVAPEALADGVQDALRRLGPWRRATVQSPDAALLDEIVDRTMEGILIEDAQGCIVFVNPAAAELLGYTRQELTGRHWTLIIPPDQQAAVRAADSRRAAGRADRYELELLRRDGSRVPVLVSGSPRLSAGQYGGSVAVFTDISGLKRTEEALRASNDTLRAMIDASPLAIMVLAPDGTVEMWNAAAEKVFGWSEAEVIGRFNPLVSPDRLEEHRVLRERAMSGEHLDGIEIVRQRKDGSAIDIRLSTAPIRNGSGVVTGILGLMADITEAKRTEAALRESEEKFRGLAEESPNMIFINQGGRVVYANPQAAIVMGYTREEFSDPAFNFMNLIAPESHSIVRANLERHRHGEDVPPYTYTLVAADGRRIDAIHTTRLIQYDGAPAILGIVTDITDQRRAEAALARRASQLEALNEIGMRVGSVTDLQALLDRTTALVQERFGYEHVAIFLRRDGDGDLEMRARAGAFAHLYPPGHRVALGRGMVGSTAASGELLLANDVGREPRYLNYFPDRVRTRAELSLPIRSEGATVGVLDVQSTHVDAFGESDILVLDILSDQLGAAMADVRHYEELRQSEERYRALTENAAIGIYRTTPEGRILFVNPAGVRMLGFDSFEELAERKPKAGGFAPAHLRPAIRERIERDGQVIGLESTWTRRDGTTIFVRENARAVHDAAGRLLFYEGTLEDFSDRKLAEQELERHAGELQVLYETSLEVSRQPDLDALLRTIIERAARLVGTNSGGLYLVRPDEHALELVVSHNLPRDFVGARLEIGEGLSGKVALHGEPMAIADYSAWEGRSQVYEGHRFGRVLGVPLRRGTDILGVIVITDATMQGDFTAEEVRLVSLFADQAALALENARLLESERGRLAELARAHQQVTGLSRVAARLQRTHDPEQVLTTLREHLLPLGVNFWLAVLDPPTGDLIVRYATPDTGLLAPLEKALGISVRGYRIAHADLFFYDDLFVERRPLLMDSTYLVRRLAPSFPGQLVERILQATGIGADSKTMCLPLETEGGVLGGLFLWGRDLSEATVESYAVFASQVAVAFEQARLLDAERQRSTALAHSHGLLAALSQVAVILERTADPDEFLQSLGGELRRIGLGCWVAMVDPEAETFVLRFASVSGDIVAQAERVIGETVIGLTIPGKRLPIYRDLVRERKPVFLPTPDLVRQLLPRLPRRAVDILMRLGAGTEKTRTIGLPLVSKDLVTGVLFVWGENLQSDDIDQYAAFASQVAVGLEKARLIEDMRQHAGYLGAVVKVAGALRAAASRGEMLPILLDQLLDLMQAEGSAVEVLLPSGLEMRTELARGAWVEWTGRVRPALDGVRGRVLHLRQPYLTDHAPADDLFHRRDDLAGARAVVCVPLVSQEQVLGLLWAGRRAPFSDSETRIAMAVADMAASAMHRLGVMENLEERVQQRTRALEEANLRLQELDEMKSDFVSNVSHELRTPIANILLYLDLLGDPARDKRREEYQAILRREAERLARLIEDLLTLSRLERDRVQLNFEAHPLDPILGEVVTTQRARAEAKSIHLIHEPDPDLPAAWVSREQIVQVFTNLVSNAVAYTPAAGTVLVSTREAHVRGRLHLVGRVHNSGPPIPPEDLPHIFERFYRGRTARFSGEPGTGLGLAICKDIVERHHGWIEVESNASVGTTFSVWLPVSPP